MVHTLKRQVNDMNANNVLDDDQDATWGGKRTRYIYNYTLQCSDLISNTADSDVTESIHSVQSKTTMEAISEADLSSDKSCGSDCDCNGQTNHTEFDVVSTSSSCHNIESNSSDSSMLIDFKVTNNIINRYDTLPDNGYNPDDTDGRVTTPKTDLPPPACFKTCLQCRKENPNPYFQYCFVCFRSRMEFFGSKPRPKTKNVKHLNVSKPKTEYNLLEDSEKSSPSNSQPGVSARIENSNTQMNENINNMCSLCYIMPKNGAFNHGKIAHIYCCYSCAKKLWRKSNKCPLCNVTIKFVTKIIVV
ncbi:protein Mdm4-like [Metopolophium dirhodum]|uniref:protein Mdm4-like n=1 Tax=Metopolophium dirhodum TaxID=44670 RepID=UPI00298F74EB|nr:protein Mdm4-like [Metopolophium dirhodum]XP_060859947.1 protein Mdm4-like [Metopolophium dirhodum]